MKVAAIQMCAELGDVPGNLARAEKLLDEALARGAAWAILPEFFTSAIAFHESLDRAALPLDGPALTMLSRVARARHAVVGGSFICVRDGERYNTFVLVGPDGVIGTHDKDIPTMWEACYYRGGSDDGVLATSIGTVGVALCWEFIRNSTARRLAGKVDLLVGGTCWAGASRSKIFQAMFPSWDERNLALLSPAPSRMARMVGVPVVHASMAGRFRGTLPLLGLPFPSHYLGETQVVDARGAVLARMRHEDGEGMVLADVTPGRVPASEPIGDGFWTEPLWWPVRWSWTALNAHGARYYAARRRAGAHS